MLSVANVAVKDALKNGGTTIWTRLHFTPTEGYCVALQGYEVILPSDELTLTETFIKVQDYLIDHYGIGDGIGLWLENDKLYLDVVVYRNNGLSDAIATGRLNNQIAIYDIKHSKAIEVG